MLSRSHRMQESLLRYWAQQAVALCEDIDDASLAEFVAPVEDAVKALEKERRIVFIGGKGCGKTSLLAAVAGCPVMAEAVWEGSYVCWRYRCDDGDAAFSRFIPEPSLEGLALVDTAPCESAGETVAGLLPGADVIVAVLDARAPQDSPVWPLLAALPQESAGAVLLALTHTDSLAAESLVRLGAEVRDLCRERLQMMPAACNVSPANAAAVETFAARVQEALGAPGGVRRTMRCLQDAADKLLYKQSSVLKKREDVTRLDSGFLASIEQEIENFLTRQRQGAKMHCEHFADSVRRVRPKLLRRFSRTYGWFLSPVTLLRLELFGAGVEKAYCRYVQQDICRLQEESDNGFVQSCAAHWKSVRPRMKQSLECEIGDFPEADLSAELAELRHRMERDINEPFRREEVRRILAGSFRESAGWMRALLVVDFLLLAAAGCTGFMGQDALACYMVAVSGALWLAGSVAHLVSAARMRRAIASVSEKLYAAMHAAMEPVTENLIVSRVSAYRRLYTAPRRKVAEHESSLQPLQKRHSEILRMLRSATSRL